MSTNDRGGIVSLVLSDSVRGAIQAESARKLPNESGGILVGTILEGIVTVYSVIGPGPRAQHGRTSFVRDGEYAQRELDLLVATSGGEWDYVAEWHSHTALAGPSTQDRRSMETISSSPAYGTPEPILLICCHAGQMRWELKAYQLRNKKMAEIPVITQQLLTSPQIPSITQD